MKQTCHWFFPHYDIYVPELLVIFIVAFPIYILIWSPLDF